MLSIVKKSLFCESLQLTLSCIKNLFKSSAVDEGLKSCKGVMISLYGKVKFSGLLTIECGVIVAC